MKECREGSGQILKERKKTLRTEKRRFMRDDEGEKGRYRMDKKKKSTELEEWRRKEKI